MKPISRKSLRNGAAIFVLFLALLAMVVTGFGTDGMGGLGGIGPGGASGATLVEVEDRDVTEVELSQQINRFYGSVASLPSTA